MTIENQFTKASPSPAEQQERLRARNMLQIMLASRWNDADPSLSADERLNQWIERFGAVFGELFDAGTIPGVAMLKSGFPDGDLKKVEKLLQEKSSH